MRCRRPRIRAQRKDPPEAIGPELIIPIVLIEHRASTKGLVRGNQDFQPERLVSEGGDSARSGTSKEKRTNAPGREVPCKAIRESLWSADYGTACG